MNFLKLTKDKLDLEAIQTLVLDETCGAISIFIGITRDHFENKKVVKLEYEAYDSMALKAKTKICNEMRAKWPDIKHIAIYHRLGIVPVKESSVIIAVSSPHRNTSLEAVQYAIDDLKKTVPIWKKEIYDENSEEQFDYHTSTSSSKQVARRNKKFKINHNINFDTCCPIQNDIVIARDLQQINASDTEIQRRVNCFIELKREEINLNNIQNFRSDVINEDKSDNVVNDGMTCSRVNSSVFSTKGSSSHLKVHRVKNEIGPQMTSNYTDALTKLTQNTKSNIKTELNSHGMDERLTNLESALRITSQSSQTVFSRLKNIEDRVLFLEAISPEYSHFIEKNAGCQSQTGLRDNSTCKLNKIPYSIEDLNEILAKFNEEA